MEKKVFGYPEFDSKGEQVLTTYDNEYRDMMMDIRVFKLKENEQRDFCKADEEMAILLLNGILELEWEDKSHVISRKDVFTQGPSALHLCKGKAVKVKAIEDSKILVQCTHNDREFESKLYFPKDAEWNTVYKDKFGGTAVRRVNTIFDYDIAPYSNMVLGEVLNDRGNWSGYIPHHHPQPETYYFMFDRPEGFGASFVGDEVFKIKDGSFSAIPGGKTHPQSAAPGFVMYTCWMIRHLDGKPWKDRIDDERYTWLYDAEFD